jgi:hypothetical protein
MCVGFFRAIPGADKPTTVKMNLINLAATLAATFWLLVSNSARSELLRLLSTNRSGYKSAQIDWAMVALLVSFILLVTMEPEARVFWMFIDAVGMDFFLLMLACQFRTNVWLIRDSVVDPLWRRFRNWAPFPMDLPTRRVMRAYHYLSGCAIAGIMMSVSFLIVFAVPFVLGMAVMS